MGVEPAAIDPAMLHRLPVFPLPSTVLFPGTVLPLHIFEPRYRQMVADALADHKTIAIVMQKQAAEDDPHPPVHEIACVGRIIHADKLEGGRYNILVHGMQRVRLLEEIPSERPYRLFRAEAIALPNEESLERASRELARLQSCVLSLRTSVQEHDAQLVEVLRSTADPVQLADVLCAAVVSDTQLQQELLACLDLKARLATLIDVLADVMVRTGEPPKEAQAN